MPAFKDVNVHELFVIDTNYYSNNLPIHYAMLNGNWAVTQFFIDNGALDKFVYDTAFLSHGDKTPFDCACAKGLRDFVLKSIKYLVENRSKDNPNLINHLLHWAALREYFEIVKYLVEEHKADVNFHLTPDSSFLHTASSKGRLEAVRFLVKNKADVNYQNSKNRTPLHEAAENAHPKVVKHLLQSGCKASFWDNEGRTAYHLAVKMKNSERGYGDTPYDEIIEDLSQSECKIQ